jgi:hypothetical protein
MPFVPRAVTKQLVGATRSFPAVILTGPRRAGNTTLLRHLFPGALSDDPGFRHRHDSAPIRGFLYEISLPAILDEIQNVPEILNYVRARIDPGAVQREQWLLAGELCTLPDQPASSRRGVLWCACSSACNKGLPSPPWSTALFPFTKSRVLDKTPQLIISGFSGDLRRPPQVPFRNIQVRSLLL